MQTGQHPTQATPVQATLGLTRLNSRGRRIPEYTARTSKEERKLVIDEAVANGAKLGMSIIELEKLVLEAQAVKLPPTKRMSFGSIRNSKLMAELHDRLEVKFVNSKTDTLSMIKGEIEAELQSFTDKVNEIFSHL